MAPRTFWAHSGLVLGVYAATLAYRLPLETLVRQQLAVLEERSGVRVSFGQGQFRPWRVELREVTVITPAGRTAGVLERLALTPSGLTSARFEGSAARWQLSGSASPTALELKVHDLPLDWVPSPPGSVLSLQSSTVTAQATCRDLNGTRPRIHAEYAWHGRLRVPPFFEDAVEVKGNLDLEGPQGHVTVDSLQGEDLRGRGNVDLQQVPGGLHLSGRLEAELKGVTTTLSIEGTPDNLTVAPTATPPNRGS